MAGPAFLRGCRPACRLLGRRGLLLTRHREHSPGPSAGRIHVPYAPFSELLPRCAALVHHGGIGTSSQAMAAGIPQVVMPMAYDQPDNAYRMVKLGVAAELVPEQFTAPNLAKTLGACSVPRRSPRRAGILPQSLLALPHSDKRAT